MKTTNLEELLEIRMCIEFNLTLKILGGGGWVSTTPNLRSINFSGASEKPLQGAKDLDGDINGPAHKGKIWTN